MITVSENCIKLIKGFEGFRSVPYHGINDPEKVFTIGYGTTFYPNGVWVQLSDPPIDEQKADTLLRWQVGKKARIIDNFLRDDLTPNQFAALISFAYNEGENALRRSTLLRLVNENPNPSDDASKALIRSAFMMWVKDEHGNTVAGLVNRRKQEADIYFTP